MSQEVERRNEALEVQLGELARRLNANLREREVFRQSLRSLLQLLDGKISELSELRDALAKLLECS